MRHSRATKLLALVGTAAVVVSLAPAGAQEPPPAPDFKAEQTYVHCGATPKAALIDSAQGNVPTWNTTAPAASVQEGAGCGTFDAPTTSFGSNDTRDISDMVWQGQFVGNLDTLTVNAHAIWMGPGKIKELAQDAAAAGIDVFLTIDGEDISLNEYGVAPKITISSTKASSEFVFSIDGLGFVEDVDLDDDGVADNIFGQATHTVKIWLSSALVQENPLMVWVWDTTEVPSGVHFNSIAADAPVLHRIVPAP